MAQNSGQLPKRRRGPGRPFQKGQVANPGGRPKKDRALLDALRDVVNPTKLAKKLWGLAMGGDLSAIRYIYDRDLGMPTQHHKVDLDAARKEARRFARQEGLDEEEAVAEVERLLADGS